jgi:hypothetical protein
MLEVCVKSKGAEVNWEIEYMQQEGIVCIKTAGNLDDVGQNQMMISEGLAEATKHEATKILLDDRDLTLNIGITDLYYLPNAFEKLGVDRKYKVAIVIRTGSIKDEHWKFYENRAANMGYSHRLFTGPDAALDWLTE